MSQFRWKEILDVRSQGILSATAQVVGYSGSQELGHCTGNSSVAAAALGKGFPNLTALLLKEGASLVKLLQLSCYSSTLLFSKV